MSDIRQTQDTGTDWLGRIPITWELRRLGSVFRERKQTVSDADFDPLSVTMQGVVPQMAHVAKTMNNDTRKLVRTGDFVINSRSDRKGSSGLSDRDGSVSVISTVLEPRAINSRYAHHLLRSTAFQEEFYRWGSGIVADLWSTRYQAMSRIQLPLPPLDEQEAIANLLDRETARIDVLIEKQTDLIRGLRSRRRAVILRAVTGEAVGDKQGWLPSGRSWTGRYPHGWRTEKVAWLFNLIGSGTTPPAEEISRMGEGLIPWVNTSELRELRIHNVVRGVAPEIIQGNSALKIYPAGTVLFAMYGATIGRMGVLDVPASVNQACLALSNPRSDVISEFVYYALQAAKGYIVQLASGGGQPNVNQEKVKSVGIPLPNYDEQLGIVNYIDRVTARIDSLIAKSERLIELSQERRSALITAAVTGQIDVAEMASGNKAT